MGAITAKYYQKCDFCHNNIELKSGETNLRTISLPGSLFDKYDKEYHGIIKADICECCEEKLRNELNIFLSIKENIDGQIDIEWKK